MSTLADARREWARRVTDSLERPDHAITFRAHQHEYILPVFEDTLLDEVFAARPPDAHRYVVATLREDSIRYNFQSWDWDEDAPDLPGMPEEMSPEGAEIVEITDSGATVADLERYLVQHPTPSDLTMDQMLERIVEMRRRAQRLKRSKRREE